MKVRNSKIIQFDMANKTAILNRTPNKKTTIGVNTIIAHNFGTGYSGYWIKRNDKEAIILSSRVARRICKYFEFVESDMNYDYYRFPFEKMNF